jgi:AraC family transcriptional regulator of adaptative response / DNA-3-methyladenine glycosylase II
MPRALARTELADPALPAASRLYAAVVAHDARFDGRVFVGVTTTGVYCRPVCRVRTPQQRNCRFFGSAARAEAAGFRPCLRCRPELAPGLSLTDSPRALALHAARQIEQAVADGCDVALPEVAARLGVTDRHLRRIFQQAHGVSPIDYLATRRLLLAKQLLTDTALPVTQVAHAAGFSSLRRFNAAFLERYRLNPTGLRRARDEAPSPRRAGEGIVLRLGYRPPYDIEGVLAFLRARALPGIESVDGATLRRALAVPRDGQWLRGWIEASFDARRHEVRVAVAPALLPALGVVVERVRQAFDLDADPAQVEPTLAAVARACIAAPRARPRGLRVPGALDGFEVAARVVLGQQVTVAAARTLARRLVDAFGERIETPHEGIDRLFPTAQAIAAAQAQALGQLGIVRQRVRALQALAREVDAGRITLHRGAPLDATLDALRALPGVGEWTAQVIALRVLAWPDAFPAADIGVLNALGTRDVNAAAAAAEAWRPWRSYAVIALWKSLETGT